MNMVSSYSDDKSVFNFVLTDPEEDILEIENYEKYSFDPKIIDKDEGRPRSFENLSSGEQVLMSLAISIFQSEKNFQLPKLLLLDEIDYSLHPSMADVLLKVLQQAFVNRGTKVVLSTHSPTTIALAPEETLHVMERSPERSRILAAERTRALSIASEGFATLEEGCFVFSQARNDKINVLSEGRNSRFLKLYFELAGIEGVNVIEGLESKSNKERLHRYVELLSCLQPIARFLVIYDCDAAPIEATGNVTAISFPQNPDNDLVSRGIENMFPFDLVRPFLSETKHPSRKSTWKLEGEEKRNFEKYILNRKKLEDFAKFEFLNGLLEQMQAKT